MRLRDIPLTFMLLLLYGASQLLIRFARGIRWVGNRVEDAGYAMVIPVFGDEPDRVEML